MEWFHLIIFCVSYWIREWSKSDEFKKGTNKATNTMVNEYEFHNEVIIIFI